MNSDEVSNSKVNLIFKLFPLLAESHLTSVNIFTSYLFDKKGLDLNLVIDLILLHSLEKKKFSDEEVVLIILLLNRYTSLVNEEKSDESLITFLLHEVCGVKQIKKPSKFCSRGNDDYFYLTRAMHHGMSVDLPFQDVNSLMQSICIKLYQLENIQAARLLFVFKACYSTHINSAPMLSAFALQAESHLKFLSRILDNSQLNWELFCLYGINERNFRQELKLDRKQS